jgi:hypothetical protein
MRLQRDIERIMLKMADRCRVGWIDFHKDSYDWQTATARAVRVMHRRAGTRITLQQARQM